jgi:hypothetical protein
LKIGHDTIGVVAAPEQAAIAALKSPRVTGLSRPSLKLSQPVSPELAWAR